MRLLALALVGAAWACVTEEEETRWADLQVRSCVRQGDSWIPGCVSCQAENESACAQCAGSYVPDAEGTSCVLPCQLEEPLCAACELHRPQACLRCTGNRIVEAGACRDCGDLYADKGKNLCVGQCSDVIPGCSLCVPGEPERCSACEEGMLLGPGGAACLVVPGPGESPWSTPDVDPQEAEKDTSGDSSIGIWLYASAGALAAVSVALVVLALRAGKRRGRESRAASRAAADELGAEEELGAEHVAPLTA